MKDYLVYFDGRHPVAQERGHITSYVEGTTEGALLNVLGENQSYIEGRIDENYSSHDSDDFYIDIFTQEVKPKEHLSLALNRDAITADGVDEAQLTGLPVPFVVKIDGQPFEVDDGSLEFVTSSPGIHYVELFSARYYYKVFDIYAS